MITSQTMQARIDAYLMNLRRTLGELPPEEVNEILREIRGHILERAEAAGDLSDERLVAILKALGRPEDIGPLYQAESLIARARSSFSPSLILRTTLRWAMVSVFGCVAFLAGMFGYLTAAALFVIAVLKPIFPDRVGAWLGPHGFSMGMMGIDEGAGSVEVLGWWIIPVSLIGGVAFLVGTSRFLRWLLRFAVRRPFVAATNI